MEAKPVTNASSILLFSGQSELESSRIFKTKRNFALGYPIGSFSIDDGNGSENVSFEMNSRFFNHCLGYSNLLKMSSVGEFPWS